MSSNAPVWAVIPAAGSGSRMRSTTPKQYLRFQGRSILEHCLDRLLSHPDIAGAVLMLCADQGSFVNGTHLLVDGGEPFLRR